MRRAKGTNAASMRAPDGPVRLRVTKRSMASSYAAFSVIQLVCSLASLLALRMYSRRRSTNAVGAVRGSGASPASAGHTPSNA